MPSLYLENGNKNLFVVIIVGLLTSPNSLEILLYKYLVLLSLTFTYIFYDNSVYLMLIKALSYSL